MIKTFAHRAHPILDSNPELATQEMTLYNGLALMINDLNQEELSRKWALDYSS
jgi:hypothetical protein